MNSHGHHAAPKRDRYEGGPLGHAACGGTGLPRTVAVKGEHGAEASVIVTVVQDEVRV